MYKSPEQVKDMLLNTIRPPLLAAAEAVDFGPRFHALLTRYPRIDDKVSSGVDMVPLERQQQIITEIAEAHGFPMKYYKSEGGFWQLNKKKYHRKDVSVEIEARQWIQFSFSVTPQEDYMFTGGTLGLIFNAIRVSQGEMLEFESGWRIPPMTWCFCEQDFYHAVQEQFALVADMLEHVVEGDTEGFRAWTKK